jgi:hypothetical protein
MTVSPEFKADVDAFIAQLKAEFLPPPPKPKAKPVAVVASEGRVIRDADVVVSPRDPNATDEKPTAVSVRAEPVSRLAGTVTLNTAAAERQYWEREADRERDRVVRRSIDPFDYGHWGRFDD